MAALAQTPVNDSDAFVLTDKSLAGKQAFQNTNNGPITYFFH